MSTTGDVLTETGWERYVADVLDGRITAGRLVKLACERHRADLERSADPDWPYGFDRRLAKRIVDFFSRLRLTKGLPAPGKMFVPEHWQQFILASLFGWVRKEDGARRFRSGHIMVARKNGKSHLMAGIGLYGLMADGEIGAEIYSAATKKDQAKIIWDAALEFRRRSGNMAEFVNKSVTSLFVISTSSKFMPLSSDEDGMDGLNTHFGLIDELQNHKNDIVFGRIDSSTAARRQPLVLTIGTAGTSRESPCWRQHEYGARVLEGVFKDETFFTYIAEADLNDNWEDPEVWKKANPNLGVSVHEDDLRRKTKVAKNLPAALNNFLRLHLNIWTQQEQVWMPMHRWRECAGELTVGTNGTRQKVNLNDRQAVEAALLAQGRRPFGGLDLSERGDITALVDIFPPVDDDARWVVLGYYFVPEVNVEERVKRDRVPYDVWIREGRVFETPGNRVDYDFVRAEVIRHHRKFNYRGLAVDPHNASMLNNALLGEGVPVVEVQQGWRSLSDPTKELLSWVLDKKLVHLGDPVLDWMAGNVAVWQDAAGNIRPDKSKARERIDGIVALVNAMSLALPKFGLRSVYMDRGVITI